MFVSEEAAVNLRRICNESLVVGIDPNECLIRLEEREEEGRQTACPGGCGRLNVRSPEEEVTAHTFGIVMLPVWV